MRQKLQRPHQARARRRALSRWASHRLAAWALAVRRLSQREPVAWRLWATDISPGNGPRRVLVRATDGTGEVQTSAPADPHPAGASGYDFVTFQVL